MGRAAELVAPGDHRLGYHFPRCLMFVVLFSQEPRRVPVSHEYASWAGLEHSFFIASGGPVRPLQRQCGQTMPPPTAKRSAAVLFARVQCKWVPLRRNSEMRFKQKQK